MLLSFPAAGGGCLWVSVPGVHVAVLCWYWLFCVPGTGLVKGVCLYLLRGLSALADAGFCCHVSGYDWYAGDLQQSIRLLHIICDCCVVQGQLAT